MSVTPWYDYSYLPCQFCVGKNHCAQCGEEIRRAILALPGVSAAEADASARKLYVTLDGACPEDVADALEALGVFI